MIVSGAPSTTAGNVRYNVLAVTYDDDGSDAQTESDFDSVDEGIPKYYLQVQSHGSKPVVKFRTWPFKYDGYGCGTRSSTGAVTGLGRG